ncbi:uncharacterized protein [Hyperolius riggenbachi]|uniref:uncharacterized protein n=1 Tax=Hyperolius riggenbachi TaxID=752182 RepID=UPI0035A299F5
MQSVYGDCSEEEPAAGTLKILILDDVSMIENFQAWGETNRLWESSKGEVTLPSWYGSVTQNWANHITSYAETIPGDLTHAANGSTNHLPVDVRRTHRNPSRNQVEADVIMQSEETESENQYWSKQPLVAISTEHTLNAMATKSPHLANGIHWIGDSQDNQTVIGPPFTVDSGDSCSEDVPLASRAQQLVTSCLLSAEPWRIMSDLEDPQTLSPPSMSEDREVSDSDSSDFENGGYLLDSLWRDEFEDREVSDSDSSDFENGGYLLDSLWRDEFFLASRLASALYFRDILHEPRPEFGLAIVQTRLTRDHGPMPSYKDMQTPTPENLWGIITAVAADIIFAMEMHPVPPLLDDEEDAWRKVVKRIRDNYTEDPMPSTPGPAEGSPPATPAPPPEAPPAEPTPAPRRRGRLARAWRRVGHLSSQEEEEWDPHGLLA